MNTRFNYLYRDAANYKEWGEVVFGGFVTDGLIARFTRALESGEFFIADQIRIPEVFPLTWPRYDDDHCWHESAGFESTAANPDDPFARTLEHFVDEVEQVAIAGWRDFVPQERHLRRR